MESWLLAAVLTIATAPTNGWTCSEDGSSGFAPENSLKISINSKNVSDIDEAKFNEIITKAETVYGPIVKAMGAKLTINRLWTTETVNANASRGLFGGNNWQVNMFGGMARHPLMTADGFLEVLCHEIGHHIGGAPKNPGGLFGMGKWASNEGQSDYWAASKCLRTLWKNDNNAAAIANKVIPETVMAACTATFHSQNEIDMCVRISLAGETLAKVLHSLPRQDGRTLPPVNFTTPDSNVVSRTNNEHPAPQCRLDTYFAGSVCHVSEEVLASQTDATVGFCSSRDAMGARPACWYKE
jgi:hypothetical protein